MEISDVKKELYKRVIEPSLMSRVFSLVMIIINTIYVLIFNRYQIIVSIACLSSRPNKPVPGALTEGLWAIFILSILFIVGSVLQILFEKRSFIVEIFINETRSPLNKLWRVIIAAYIVYALYYSQHHLYLVHYHTDKFFFRRKSCIHL